MQTLTQRMFIKTGTNYACIVCNRSLCRRSLIIFSRDKHKSFADNLLCFVKFFDYKYYIYYIVIFVVRTF